MGTLAYFAAIAPDHFARLRKRPTFLKAYIFPNAGPDDPLRYVHFDKAWHGIHYLLTGAAKGGLEPYSLTVLGGEMTLCEPARYLPPEQVKRIAEALTNLPEQALRDRFDPNAMEDAEIYPRGVWVRDGPRVLDYVLRHYQDLVAFYQASALRGDGVLVWIG